jgi:threonyl-tRNA synthetase
VADSIDFTFPDGSVHTFPAGITGLEVAESIGPRLAKAAIVVKVDGVQFDVKRPLEAGGAFEVVTADSEEGLFVIRHSTAHVLAQAVLASFPGAQFAIGPPITDGFYYDFDIGRPFTPDDIELLEGKMHKILAEDQPFDREVIDRDQGLEMFADQRFKTEIITDGEASQGVGDGVITVYRNHDFVDLCRGPHVRSTGFLSAFRLLRSAGAYWRGDEHNPQLQRIYGTAWDNQKDLDAYLERLEEADRRDHRKLGVALDLFSFPSELGSGLAVWHPRGALVRKIIEDYSRNTHLAHDYDIVSTPHVAKANLWETSGHLDFYAEGMYPSMELDHGQDYYVKPMNCPFHILVYQSSARSYRRLPMRLFELGTVYRYERSGVLHGLLRIRGFTQDDSHIFCTESQLAEELQGLLDFTLMVLRDFGFEDFEADLSTMPDKAIGDLALWERATDALRSSLEVAELPYEVAEGEGAFYGPKIDVHVRDAIGRRWQLSTIQVDFAQPENFELEYNSPENTRERPVMIHRALMGSIERFAGILIEHYAGAFPGWLAPVQAAILPVADRHNEYAERVAAELTALGLRVEVDDHDDTLGEKVRRAITSKTPAVLVVGDDDVAHSTVGLRLRDEEGEERGVPVTEAGARLVELCAPPR